MLYEGKTLMLHGARRSRRGILQAAGAGMIASVLGSRLSASAWAQDAFTTRVQVLHAAPGLGQVEVQFNYVELLDEFNYGQTSEWLDIEPGAVRVTITMDRAGFNYYVFDGVYPAPVGNDYRLIISDPLIIPMAVDRAPLAADMSRARVVHASVALPNIDIAMAGGDVLLSDLRYAQLSDPAEVPSGTYDLEVRLTGSDDVALELPGLTLEPGMTYDVVVYGVPGSTDTPLTAAVLSDTVNAGEPMASPTAATPTA